VIYFLVPGAQDFGIQDYLHLYAPELAELVGVVHYEDLPRRTSSTSGTYIFSALDQLSAGGMSLVCALADQLLRADARSRVINHPARVLLRLELLEALYRDGLNRHRAVRASGDLSGLRFPVFLREEFRHTGAVSPLLHNRAELESAVGRAVFRGSRLGELLVVEFCDTADAQGRYGKFAAFVIGSRIIADHYVIGHEWMLKAEDNEVSETNLMQERGYVLGNPHEAELRRIFERAGVEYGRIDYSLKDGKVETWEVNLNPTIRRGRRPDFPRRLPEALDRIKDVARQHFLTRFEAAIRSLDTGEPPIPLRLEYTESCLRAAASMLRPAGPGGWLVPVARVLRPLLPLLKPLSRIIQPLVGRTALRKRSE